MNEPCQGIEIKRFKCITPDGWDLLFIWKEKYQFSTRKNPFPQMRIVVLLKSSRGIKKFA